MHKIRALDSLFPKTRQAILAATLMHPDRWWYLSDLAGFLKLRPSSLQRELVALVDAGILRRKKDGNRVYFQPDPQCPFLPELQGLLTKTAGLVDVLREALAPFADAIVWAFVYGSIARSQELSASDVDLMVIGALGLADLAAALRRAEHRLDRSINPTVYTAEEFARKLKSGNHFLQNVLDHEKLFILGHPDDLAATIGRSPRASAPNKPARA